MGGMSEEVRDHSWKPNGWDEWSLMRRRLWRRETQATRMEQLTMTPPERASERDKWVAHLRAEAAELRRELGSDDVDTAAAP